MRTNCHMIKSSAPRVVARGSMWRLLPVSGFVPPPRPSAADDTEATGRGSIGDLGRSSSALTNNR